jgi:uncharacterized phage protein (TIGR01671 family)
MSCLAQLKANKIGFFMSAAKTAWRYEMERVIKFRGHDGKKWIFGCGAGVTQEGIGFIVGNVYAPNKRHLEDVYANATAVNSESIGQFIGLTDKNGVEIYEKDTCKLFSLEYDSEGYHVGLRDSYVIGVVEYHNGAGCMWDNGFIFNRKDGKNESVYCDENAVCWYAEVIGNVFENNFNNIIKS